MLVDGHEDCGDGRGGGERKEFDAIVGLSLVSRPVGRVQPTSKSLLVPYLLNSSKRYLDLPVLIKRMLDHWYD